MSEKPCPPKLIPVCPGKDQGPTDRGDGKVETKVDAKADTKVHTDTKVPIKVEAKNHQNHVKKVEKPPHCKELWHPGFDARFPNQNQTRRCWVSYVDYIRCQEKFGEDHKGCEYFKKTYTHLCPEFWIEKWDEQRENGTFPMPRWA